MSENKPPVITRVFNAPTKSIWRAWTDPEQVKKWWGPKNFTAPVASIDLKVGGKYLYCMRGVPGPGMGIQDFWSTGTYEAIVPGRKLVVLDSFADKEGNIVPSSKYDMEDFPLQSEITITFDEQPDGQTRLIVAYSDPVPEEHLKNMLGGWNSSLDKLADTTEHKGNK